MEMDRLIEDFVQDCKIRGMSPRSIPHYGYIVRKFLDFLNQRGVDVSSVDKEVLRDYIQVLRIEGDMAQKTVENHFSILSSFYEFLIFEDVVSFNPVLPVRKRYLRRYKDNGPDQERKLISVEEMAQLINSTLNIRDKAIISILAKTGIRRNELITLDLGDVNFIEQEITLKPTAKRSNKTVFFDDETSFILNRWIKIRDGLNKKGLPALFLNSRGDRLNAHGVYLVVANAAQRIGLHDPGSDRMQDHFTPHCLRHWNTTHLRRAGMPREFIQELRGDVRKEAIDIYDHIDKKELRESYLAHIPQLGI